MKRVKRTFSLLLTIMMLLTLCITDIYAENEIGNARQVVSLNGIWSFTDPDVGSAVDVQVPHSWENYKSGDNMRLNTKTCSYEKTVDVSSLAGKKLFLRFNGVNKIAVVSVDGKKVGTHTGGFTAFAIDITKACAGKSKVKIRVDVTNMDFETTPINVDFTHFAGIYRDVQLIAADSSAYIANEDYGSDGVYLYTDVNLSDGSAALTPHVMVSYDDRADRAGSSMKLTVKTILSDRDGNMVKSTEKSFSAAGSKAAEEVILPEISIEKAHLWNGTIDPYLYSVTTELYKNGKLVDVNNDRIGFRKYEVKNGDFYLNGNLYELHGVGMHQEFGAKTNVTTAAQKAADIDMVLEMGANALRTCHYPHDPYIYDLCDEKGLVVWNEIPFYQLMLNTDTFKNNVKDNAVEMVKQGYNHPSIIVWGIENEVNYYPGQMPYWPTQGNEEQMGSFMKELAGKVHALDPSRMIGEAEIDGSGTVKQTAGWTTADSNINVVGFNIYNGWYGKITGATENNKINYFVKSVGNKISDYQDIFNTASGNTTSYVLTEYGAGANIEHHEDLGENFIWGGSSGKQGYVTSGQFHPEEYQSYVHEGMKMAIYGDKTRAVAKSSHLWAAFAWCMFDFSCYRNEGGTARLNTKGLVTADRKTKKDAFYFYKANWNTEDYFTYICSKRAGFREKKNIEVKVYSNCESVNLIVNGDNLGEGIRQQDGVFIWKDVPLNRLGKKNTVKAVGSQNGEIYTDTCENWIYDPVTEIKVTGTPDKVYDGNPAENPAYKVLSNGTDVTGDAEVSLEWYKISDSFKEKLTEGAPTEPGEYLCEITVKEGFNHDNGWYSASHQVPFYIAEEPVETGTHENYIIGYDDGTVRPKANITRAETAALFYRLLSDEERKKYFRKDNSYSDVSEGMWYNNEVSTLSNAGILSGYPDHTFRPKTNVSRAEFAAIVSRFNQKADNTGESRFTDITGHWAADYINSIAKEGIISGYPDGTFRPDQNITRAEAMTMINRSLKRTPDAEYMLNGMNTWIDNADTSAWYYAQVQEATNSHKYMRKEESGKEKWTEMLDNKDWSHLQN